MRYQALRNPGPTLQFQASSCISWMMYQSASRQENRNLSRYLNREMKRELWSIIEILATGSSYNPKTGRSKKRDWDYWTVEAQRRSSVAMRLCDGGEIPYSYWYLRSSEEGSSEEVPAHLGRRSYSTSAVLQSLKKDLVLLGLHL